jgi:hypothetical protein
MLVSIPGQLPRKDEQSSALNGSHAAFSGTLEEGSAMLGPLRLTPVGNILSPLQSISKLKPHKPRLYLISSSQAMKPIPASLCILSCVRASTHRYLWRHDLWTNEISPRLQDEVSSGGNSQASCFMRPEICRTNSLACGPLSDHPP